MNEEDAFLKDLYVDDEKHLFFIGSRTSFNEALTRHPSVEKWWVLKGDINHEQIASLYDSFLRDNMYSSRPYPVMLMKMARELGQDHFDKIGSSIQKAMAGA